MKTTTKIKTKTKQRKRMSLLLLIVACVVDAYELTLGYAVEVSLFDEGPLCLFQVDIPPDVAGRSSLVVWSFVVWFCQIVS